MAIHRRQLVMWSVGLGLGGLTALQLFSPRGFVDFFAGLGLVTLQLVTLFLVLADLDLRIRAMVVLTIGLPIALVLSGLMGSGGRVFGGFLSMLAIMIGVLLPVRLYVGSLGLPRCDDAPRRASLLSLFLLTTYYAVLAAVFAQSVDGPELAIFGLILAIVAVGPLLLLTQSLGLRILGGLITRCLALAAVYIIAMTVAHRLDVAPLQLLMTLWSPAVCALLWAYGYRLRR